MMRWTFVNAQVYPFIPWLVATALLLLDDLPLNSAIVSCPWTKYESSQWGLFVSLYSKTLVYGARNTFVPLLYTACTKPVPRILGTGYVYDVHLGARGNIPGTLPQIGQRMKLETKEIP